IEIGVKLGHLFALLHLAFLFRNVVQVLQSASPRWIFAAWMLSEEHCGLLENENPFGGSSSGRGLGWLGLGPRPGPSPSPSPAATQCYFSYDHMSFSGLVKWDRLKLQDFRLGWHGPWREAQRHALDYFRKHLVTADATIVTVVDLDGKIED